MSKLRFHYSAFKHGITREDILHVLNTSWNSIELSEDPQRMLYLGFDQSSRPIEVIIIKGDDGGYTAIHAMPARKQYLPRR